MSDELEMKEMEFDFNFSDNTINEADGVFEEVKSLMESEFPRPETWMLRSTLTIDSIAGLSQFILHFYHDRRIIIRDYDTTVGDNYYNQDIPALSAWTQEKGWKFPEPAITLVKRNIELWKSLYDKLLIDSEYLDSIFGDREVTHKPSEGEE